MQINLAFLPESVKEFYFIIKPSKVTEPSYTQLWIWIYHCNKRKVTGYPIRGNQIRIITQGFRKRKIPFILGQEE